jgi:hypothetical protein
VRDVAIGSAWTIYTAEVGDGRRARRMRWGR